MSARQAMTGIAYAGVSDIGRVREQNQDAILLPSPAGEDAPLLFLLADGMGGASGGQVASSLAIQSAAKYFAGQGRRLQTREALEQAVQAASAAVHQRARDQPELKGMGTTLVALALEGWRALVANVGDSRCYLWREASLRQVTQDHSLVQQLVREGSLSPQEARGHKMRNVVTRVVGVQAQARADFFPLELRPGDVLLLCSDGLHGPLADDDLARILREPALDLEAKAHALAAAANQRGGPDNISVILIGVEGAEATRASWPANSATTFQAREKPAALGPRPGGKLAWVIGLAVLLLGVCAWAFLSWPPAAPAPVRDSGPPAAGIVLEPTEPAGASPPASAAPAGDSSAP